MTSLLYGVDNDNRLERLSSVDTVSVDLPHQLSPFLLQKRGADVVLPDDFLRIPRTVVDKWWVKERSEEETAFSSENVEHYSDSDSEEDCMVQKDSLECAINVPLGHRYKVRLEKDSDDGLGITLKFISKYPVVRSLSSSSNEIYEVGNVNKLSGVAERAGIQPGDVLVSVLGDGEVISSLTSLDEVGAAIKTAPSEFHLLFDRPLNQQELGSIAFLDPRPQQESSSIKPIPTNRRAIPIAPLVSLLHAQGLFDKGGAEALSAQLHLIKIRSRQWQRHNKIFVERNPPMNSAPASSSFLASLLWGQRTSSQRVIEHEVMDDILSVPIHAGGGTCALSMEGIRPAIVVRILGLSKTSDHTEYIVWVLDVISGNEWRVLRRFRDFQRLEEDIFKMRSALRSVLAPDFPSRRLSHIYESVPGSTALDRAFKLSRWLKRLATQLPGCGDQACLNLNTTSPLVQLALQRFLEATSEDISRRMSEKMEVIDCSNDSLDVGVEISRVVHVFAHRILTLPALEQSVFDFIAKLGEQYESRNPSTLAFDVGESMLVPMKSFMDLLQECILKGCHKELRSHLRRHMKNKEVQGKDDSVLVEKSILKGVRRAVECEVYVPLMGKVQRSLLGIGAINENDFKVERRRIRAAASKIHGKYMAESSAAQLALGIHPNVVSPSGWSEVSRMLGDIDNRYSLPCDRIAALVKAGRGIPKTFLKEHAESDFVIGADDILPVFIYALTGASIRDLTAVRRLLHTFADERSREGEEGYYLTTLNAAFDHIADETSKH